MVSKYWLVMKSEDGRLILADSMGIINESGQQVADSKAMELLGKRLIEEARVLQAASRPKMRA